MPSKKMQITQNLTNELVKEYTHSKYNEEYLKEKINKILEFILSEIAIMIQNREEKESVGLWNNTKENGEIENMFRKLTEKIDRPIVIYVASKFKNNKYFGIKIIEEASTWK